MSQVIFDSIDPDISGTALAGILNDFKDAIVSGLIGSTRPTELAAGGAWIDNSNDPTSWSFKIWTGVDDVEVFVIDLATGSASVSLAVDSFMVRKVSADTVGAILNLVKRRIATNGQVLSGDVVGEIRMVGRTDSSGDPIVAKIIFTAGENQTSSANGGTLSFYSTPAGMATLVEHMRFAAGEVETVVPLKVNAEVLVGQNVASATTIAQLAADKILVEITGSTVTSIQGLNSGQASKVVTVHNRASVNVTMKHQDASAAAADRMALPESKDITMLPNDSVTLYYCSADTRWKVLYASARFGGFTNETFYQNVASWVAPSALTKIRLVAHSRSTSFMSFVGSSNGARILDVGKNLWTWGFNFMGTLGVGDVTSRSSPTQVLNGRKFIQVETAGNVVSSASWGLTENGDLYAWGGNSLGELGQNDVIPKSSPVAVVGGYKFKAIFPGNAQCYAIAQDGTPYAWGANLGGELGDGTVVYKSSPVALVGGYKFREMISNYRYTDPIAFGITLDGDLYGWGYNFPGSLGIGDMVARSSPVLVLGSLKWKKVWAGAYSAWGITESGDLYAWGRNESGQLGLGDQVDRSSPVAVVGGRKWKDISTGLTSTLGTYTVGLTEDGAAYVWGENTNGQHGDGTVTTKSSPVAVLGGHVFKSLLNTGNGWIIGLKDDGTAYAWGYNPSGNLGVGDVTPRSSPVAVLGGLSFQEMNGSGDVVLALGTNGILYAWGFNGGALGVGDTAARSSPVAVLGGLGLKTQDDSTTVLDIPVTGGNTYALKLGPGPCFFGSKPIGNNIQKVEISYVP